MNSSIKRLLAAVFLADLGKNLTHAAVSIYLYQISQSGLLASLFFISSRLPKVFLSKYVGEIVDRLKDPKNAHTLGQMINSSLYLTAFLTGFWKNPYALVGFYLVIYVSTLFIDLSKNVITKRFSDKESVKYNSVLVTSLPNIAMGIGAGVGLYANKVADIGTLFLISAIGHGLACFVVSSLLENKTPEERNEEKGDIKSLSYKEIFFGFNIYGHIVEQLAVGWISGALPLAVNIHLAKISNISDAYFNYFLIGCAGGSILNMLFFKGYSDYLKSKKLRIGTIIGLSLIQLLILFLSKDLPMFGLILVAVTSIQTVLYFMVMSWYDAEILYLIPQKYSGQITGSVYSLEVFTISFVGILLGLLDKVFPLLQSFLTITTIGIIISVILAIKGNPEPKRIEQQS